MFVLIEFQSVINRFRFSIPNIKNRGTFCSDGGSGLPIPQNKKAHGVHRERSSLLVGVTEIVQISVRKEKRKRFMSICYSFSLSILYSLDFGEKSVLYCNCKNNQNNDWVTVAPIIFHFSAKCCIFHKAIGWFSTRPMMLESSKSRLGV